MTGRVATATKVLTEYWHSQKENDAQDLTIVGWDSLRTSLRHIPDDALEAVVYLSTTELSSLLKTAELGEPKLVGPTLGIVFRGCSDELGAAWIDQAGSASMRRLGFQIWLRRMWEERAAGESASKLELFVDSVAAAVTGAERANLWWEAVCMAPRLSFGQDTKEFVLALYNVAVAAVAEFGGLPSASQLRTYRDSAPQVVAIIPYIAQHLEPDLGAEALGVFTSAVREDVLDDSRPLTLSLCDALYLEASAIAVTRTDDQAWWIGTIREGLVQKKWAQEPNRNGFTNAMWLLCAASIAASKDEQQLGDRRAAAVLELVSSQPLFWDTDFDAALELELVKNYAKVVVRESRTASLYLSKQVRSAALLEAVTAAMQQAWGEVPDEVDALLKERRDFESQLDRSAELKGP